jgi:hypothetical protein
MELLMGKQKRISAKKSLDVQTASKRLLKPLLRVLFAAGLTRSELLRTCEGLAAGMLSKRSMPKLRQVNYDPSLERVISLWTTNPEFSSTTLPLRGRIGSFHALAKAAVPARRPSALLKQLRELRLVRSLPKARVRLLDQFVPIRSGNAFDLAMFTELTVDFLRTHEVNLLSGAKRGEGLFQRVARRNNFGAHMAPLFDRFARKQGQLLLASVDDWFARHGRVERKRSKARLGVGVYLINSTVGTKGRS